MHHTSSTRQRARTPVTTRRALLAAPLLAAVVSLGGCSLTDGDDDPAGTLPELVAWPEKDIWPEALLAMPQATIDNYKAVIPRKDLLQYMPCYCGCYAVGHRSVYDCYVAEVRDDGSILLDTMSFG